MKLPTKSVLCFAAALSLMACTDESAVHSSSQDTSLQNDGVDLNASPLGNSVDSGYYFSPETALAKADAVGYRMSVLLDALAGTIISEYEANTGSGLFTDNTVDISKRISNKTGCEHGDLESSLTYYGVLITGGVINYENCYNTGLLINGGIAFTTESTVYGERLTLSINNLSTQQGATEVVYDGEVDLSFIGDEVEVSTDRVSMRVNGLEEVWTQTELTGRLGVDGERTLHGSTQLVSYYLGELVFIELDSVTVPAGDTVPRSGSQVMTHSDTSRLEIVFGSGSDNEVLYSTSEAADPAITGTRNWANLLTRVPLHY